MKAVVSMVVEANIVTNYETKETMVIPAAVVMGVAEFIVATP